MRKVLNIVLLLLSFICCFDGMAQTRGDRKDREQMRKEMDEFKAKFIAQEMGLDKNDEKQFIELYQQMLNEKFVVLHPVWRAERNLKKNRNASEQEYVNVSKLMSEAKEKDAEIERRYEDKFSSFLSAKQIFKMKAAEDAFRRKMEEMRITRIKKK